MLTVKEAIEKRRSVRKFKPDPVPDEYVEMILEAARLAPSASNRQPWRFLVLKDPELKRKITDEATLGQEHVATAPVAIVCASELLTFVKGHKLAPPGSEYFGAESEKWEDLSKFLGDAHMNTAIAMEHMVLMATALGLGSCWVQRIRYGALAKILGWPRHRAVNGILVFGYPDEEPVSRGRLPREDLLV